MPNLKSKDFHDVRLMDIDTHEVFSDVLRMMFVSLADAKKTWEQCNTKYEKIIFLIKNLHLMDKESAAYKSGEFEDIFNEAELDNMVAEDVVAYSESKLRYEDDLAALDYNYEKGKTEGLAEGLAEGKAEGIIEGLYLSAKKMLEAKMDVDFIHQVLGLPIEEIRKL